MSSPIIEKFHEVVNNVGDKPAIIEGRRAVSFGQMSQAVGSYSVRLARRGVRKGDRVLIFVPMSIRLYVILLAVWRCGAVAIFVDAWTRKNRLNEVAQQTNCKAFIGVPKAHLLRLFSRELRSIRKKYWEMPFKMNERATPALDATAVSLDDTALVTFTTGSTGRPKGADRTHGFLLAQNKILSQHLQMNREDIDLSTLPVFVLNNLANGITSVLAPFNQARPEDLNPRRVAKVIDDQKVTTAAGSPVVFEKLAEHCNKTGTSLNTLTKVFIGGAPVFPHLAKKLISAFPAVDIEIVYGSTEAEPISAISASEIISTADDLIERGLAVGRPVPQIDLVILKLNAHVVHEMNTATFEAACAHEKAVGEICVSGEHVLKRYFNNQQAQSENKIVVGGRIWHRTGDAGYLNSTGHLFLMGRVSQRLQINGQLLFPFPYEEAIGRIDGVKMGTLLSLRGEIVVAVELTSYRKSERASVAQALTELKLPSEHSVRFCRIPRDPRHNSKIDYGALMNNLSGGI